MPYFLGVLHENAHLDLSRQSPVSEGENAGSLTITGLAVCQMRP